MQSPRILFFFFVAGILFSCSATKPVTVTYSDKTSPTAPDYSNSFYWSALPDKKDSADHVPSKSPVILIDGQETAKADVFFIYPTQFYSETEWNADLNDIKLNKQIDTRAIKNQATVFNGSCKIYAPRYRQASYNTYFSLTNPDADKAFALAYSDIKNAFQYYLDNYNDGRPIIIAGHSQGTKMAQWILRDFFDGNPLHDKLIVAYLIGTPVYNNEFKTILPCDSANQTGCFISWRTYLEGNEPKVDDMNKENIIVMNPLTFSREISLADQKLNSGGLNRDSETIIPEMCNAQIHDDILWVSKPDVPGKALLFLKNLHIADYNLFWLPIRENVAKRIDVYFESAH
ncbi:MAG: DUF3089 domain-containing protein [Fimbriimonadaceae bacterium]|nr:DUF3089 domain-containing protein [Chitinophagales bacterium]